MLRHLRVTNFAILSDVSIELVAGMNAITGETGAGKSLIVEAVNLLRGGRASADIPRAGAKEAVVEAIFEMPEDITPAVDALLDHAGLPSSDGEVLVRRVISRGGRSRTYVNGALTTAKRLAQIGALLVDLSGQHQHQGLVDPSRHRTILDAFCSAGSYYDESDESDDGDGHDLLATMAQSWQELQRAQGELDELAGDERQREERIDYLRFQLDELEAAQLDPDEDDHLEARRSRLESVDQLESGARQAEALVYSDDDSAYDRLGTAFASIERLVNLDATLDEPAKQLQEARALAEDAASTLRSYADDLEGDPMELARLDERLTLIGRLARKHGGSVGDMLERANQIRAELETLDRRDERLAELESELTAIRARATATAKKITLSRRKAGLRLCEQVGSVLAELGMAGATLSVAIHPREKPHELGPDGADRVEFLLCSNKGEEAKPLARIASGGELSRIMLAMKLALRSADAVATYVFDEVDSGIGGDTAETVGRQIRALADQRQVICVTHQPQIAVFADGHFHVSKLEVNGRTETHVRRLQQTDRRDETARMLSGSLTSRAKAHASEMLRTARS